MHNRFVPILSCLIFSALGWQQRADWLELGPGECRPQPCHDCSHPWATRTKCMPPDAMLENCLDFAAFNAPYPTVEGFELRKNVSLSANAKYLTITDSAATSRQQSTRWNAYSLDEAAARCNSSSACRGFECYSPQNTCTYFSDAEPIACEDTFYCGDTRAQAVYMKTAGSPSGNPPTVAAVAFGHTTDCPGASLTCKAYDGSSSALGVDTSTIPSLQDNRQLTCYRPIEADGRRSEDTGVAISMQDADGQEITVTGVDTSVAMHGPFGLVSVHLKFNNPQDRTIEGRFRYMLPPGAVVQRLAMKIHGSWMEGEVVERSKARRIWRSLLIRRRDPALFEQEQGNMFSAKVFPIFARANVELILAYSKLTLMKNGVRRLTIPMAGLPPVTVLRTFVVAELAPQESVHTAMGPRGLLEAKTVAAGMVGYEKFDSGIPMNDIVVEIKGSAGNQAPTSLRAGDYIATWRTLKLSDTGPPAPRARGGKWRFYVDTSASTADTYAARINMVYEFLTSASEKAAPASCAVFAFDMGDPVQLIAEAPPTSELASLAADKLRKRLPLGLTRLDRVLSHAASSGADHVVLVTDAIATLGDRGARLPLALADRPKTTKIYVLTIGSKVDLEAASEIAGAGGGRVVSAAATSKPTVASGRMAKAWDELLAPMGATGNVTDHHDESAMVHPKRFFDLQPDSEVVYFAKKIPSDESAPDLYVDGNLLVAPSVVDAAPSFRPLLEREGVRAHLAELNHDRTLTDNRSTQAALVQQMVSLSTTKRVLCPLTALLVLETEWDYQRFEVIRSARNDILVVSPSGIELQRPSPPTFLEMDNISEYEEETDEPEPATISNDKLADSISYAASSFPRLFTILLGVLPIVYALRRASLLEVAVVIVCVATLLTGLQGCEGSSCDDDDCWWSPEWLDVKAWAEAYMSKVTKPTERLRMDAQLWSEALAALGRSKDLLSFTSAWLLWDPANPDVYEFLGSAALALGDVTTAVRAYASLAEISSSNPEMLLRAAWLSLKAQDYALAESLAQRSIDQRDDNPNAYRALAIARYLQDNMPGAREAISSAKLPSPDRWGQRHTSQTLLRELQHMEEHAGRGTLGDGRKRLVLEKSCAEENCKTLNRCEAEGSGVPANLLQVVKPYDCCGKRCALCDCNENASSVAKAPQIHFAMSWLGDGNDVDLYLGDADKKSSALGPTSQLQLDTFGLGDVNDGLGPESMITNSKLGTNLRVGTFYNWNSAMGSARGVIVVWVSGVRDPKILPFALPVQDNTHIMEVARVRMAATPEEVSVSWNPLMR